MASAGGRLIGLPLGPQDVAKVRDKRVFCPTSARAWRSQTYVIDQLVASQRLTTDPWIDRDRDSPIDVCRLIVEGGGLGSGLQNPAKLF
jgi:hypothetical protein